MIAALPLLLTAALVFVEQDLPGVRVGPPNPFSGIPETNYRQTDLDGDGALDLVLPREMCFQRAGGFPADARVSIPHADERPYADVTGRAIYLRFEHRLIVLRWEHDAFREDLDQAMTCPAASSGESALWGGSDRDSGVRFDRFVYDLDVDGTPEIVIPAADGIHIFTRSAQGYLPATVLDLLPPLGLARIPQQTLWPSDARRILFPARAMACRCSIERNRLTILTREDAGAMRVQYRVKRYSLDPRNSFQLVPDAVQQSVTEPMPSDFRLCRLNQDDVTDYAGGDWEFSTASAIPTPIYETRATLDGGKTIRIVRSQSFRPQCSFVDVNNDGNLDMIAETTGLAEGGIRETISRFLTVRAIHHEIGVRFQNAQGQFSKDPDMSARLTIQLDAPPFRGTDFFQRYGTGELVDVTGDFNGDGRKDILAQDRPNRLAVMLNQGNAFNTRPDATIAMTKEGRFGVADVNGDGRSDVVITERDTSEHGRGERTRVFFAREAQP